MVFIPDPIPEICQSLTDAGWDCPIRAGAQFMTIGPSIAVIITADGSKRVYRPGFLVEIPIYQSAPVIVKAAAERSDGGILVFDHKDARHKVPYDGPHMPTVKGLLNLGSQVLGPFGELLLKRIRQAEAIPASLEECLVVNTKCHNFHYEALRIDDALNAHRLASPNDRWPMYRRQANTPNTKLDLVDALSEYATVVPDAYTKLDYASDAGDMLIDYGDLEARPAWHYWE